MLGKVSKTVFTYNEISVCVFLKILPYSGSQKCKEKVLSLCRLLQQWSLRQPPSPYYIKHYCMTGGQSENKINGPYIGPGPFHGSLHNTIEPITFCGRNLCYVMSDTCWIFLTGPLPVGNIVRFAPPICLNITGSNSFIPSFTIYM